MARTLTPKHKDELREAGEPVPRELRTELRNLSDRRLALRWGGRNE